MMTSFCPASNMIKWLKKPLHSPAVINRITAAVFSRLTIHCKDRVKPQYKLGKNCAWCAKGVTWGCCEGLEEQIIYRIKDI